MSAIPAGWLQLPISEIASFGSGDLIAVSKLSAPCARASVPVFGGNGIAGYTSLATVVEPTVILGRVGQKCGVVYRNDGPAWITDNALYARRLKRPADIRFLALALEAARLNDVKNKNDLPLITQSILKDVTIAWPVSIEEQRRIAETVSAAEESIGALERLISKMRAVQQGMMQQLLTGRTRLPGFADPWITTTWGEVAQDIVSGATPLRSRSQYWNGSIPWVTSTELKRGIVRRVPQNITQAGLRAANLNVWPAGTFLMAITGLEAAGTRGSCGVLGVSAATNQSCMAVVPNSRLDNLFLFYYYLLRGEELALRYTQGTKQQSYTAGIVRTLPIDMPIDVVEQRAIASALNDVAEEIETLGARLAKAKAIKQGMMQQLLTGRARQPVREEAS